MTNLTKTVIKNADRTNNHNKAKFSYRANREGGFTLQTLNGVLFAPDCEETIAVLNHAEALELAQALLAFVASANEVK